jgi:hypothetical protein
MYREKDRCLFWDPYKTHKVNVITMWNSWTLNLVVREVAGRLWKSKTLWDFSRLNDLKKKTKFSAKWTTVLLHDACLRSEETHFQRVPLTSRIKTLCYLRRIELDPDPRQNGVVANAALSAVTLNFQNEDWCELSDKIMYAHILVLYSVFCPA